MVVCVFVFFFDVAGNASRVVKSLDVGKSQAVDRLIEYFAFSSFELMSQKSSERCCFRVSVSYKYEKNTEKNILFLYYFYF